MPSSGLDFPGVDFLREQINRSLIMTDFKLPVVVDCSRISTLDYTSVKGIEALMKDLRKQNQTMTLVNLDEKLERLLSSITK
jgi:anti-anti-sigma regulatory factor